MDAMLVIVVTLSVIFVVDIALMALKQRGSGWVAFVSLAIVLGYLAKNTWLCEWTHCWTANPWLEFIMSSIFCLVALAIVIIIVLTVLFFVDKSTYGGL